MTDPNIPTAGAPPWAGGLAWPGQPPQAPPAPAEAPAPEASAPVAPAAKFSPGQLVRHRYFDPYVGAGGEEVTRFGLVVDVVPGAGPALDQAKGGDPTDGVVVFWIDDVSHPVPAGELELATS